MRSNGIKHIRSTPYHPATNGAVERLVKDFQADHESWTMIFSQCNIVCKILLDIELPLIPPQEKHRAMLFLGRQLRTRFDLLQPCLEKKVIEHQASQKQHHDQHSRMR